MTFQEKLENYFHTILNFDWGNFNKLDRKRQSRDWQKLLGEFDRLIRDEHLKKPLDFEFVYDTISTYRTRFEELPIKSSLYTIINKYFIAGRLYGFARDLAFEEAKKASEAICDCTLIHQFNKKPDTKNLKELKILYDGYYNPTLLKCTICDFQWISYIADDSTGQTVYEKYIL